MLNKRQIEAIVKLAKTSVRRYSARVEAERIGVTEGSLRVHLHNYRRGRVPPSWRRVLEEKSE